MQDNSGHRLRLRQRFLLSDGRDMADYELLELVLTYSIVRKDVKPIAKELIAKLGSFNNVLNASSEELLSVNGVGDNTLVMLKVIRSSGIRSTWQVLQSSDEPILSSIDSLLDYCRSSMCAEKVEELKIFYLDNKLKLISADTEQKGTVNQVAVHPRELIKKALDKGASAIIMVHNHPTGDVTPSRADIEMTKIIKEACKAVGIRLLDHIIISQSKDYSFRSNLNIIID